MHKILSSEKVLRLREFMMTGRYMMLLFAVAAVFSTFELNVSGVLCFACIIGFTLVISDDMLATFMPFMLTCLLGAKCYNSFSVFIKHIPLGVLLIICILDRKSVV